MPTIYKINELNYDLIKCTRDRCIYYNNDEPLLVELPFMLLNEKNDNYLVLNMEPRNKDIMEYLNLFIKNINQSIINIIKVNGNKWGIDKTNKFHVLGSKRIIKINTDETKTFIFNTQKELIDKQTFASMTNELYIKSLIQITKINIENGDITIELFAHQLIISPVISFNYDFSSCLLNLEDEVNKEELDDDEDIQIDENDEESDEID